MKARTEKKTCLTGEEIKLRNKGETKWMKHLQGCRIIRRTELQGEITQVM